MPDKKARVPDKGWRKKINVGRPKTPIPPKAPPEEAAVAEEPRERRHHSEKLGWRRTMHANRPETPLSTAGPAPGGDDGDDVRSEHSEPSTPRRKSSPKPRLKRYLSSYLTLTAAPTIDWSEPWSEDAPSAFIAPVDPLLVLQSVHSYVCQNPGQPLPVQHNSGLLHVFEDYQKIRGQKERLEALLQETLDGYRNSEGEWTTAEDSYRAEIRRLELIIARGTSGMAGLIKARQGTIVRRKRTQKANTANRPDTKVEFLTRDELDKEIISRSRQVPLHRPTSPSDQMAVLSKQFRSTGSWDGLTCGTPPSQDPKITLARKVKSELDLINMAQLDAFDTTSQSVYSEFSATGDQLPDEGEPSNAAILDARIESEAFVALRDLGILVARRKGMDANRFLSKLMSLFSIVDVEDATSHTETYQEEDTIQGTSTELQQMSNITPGTDVGARPRLGSGRGRRRHFSFEPGDDDLALLEEKLGRIQTRQGKSPRLRSPLYQDLSGSSSSSSLATSLNTEAHKPSKIPSPVQIMGSARRQSSAASLQTIYGKASRDGDQRRDSRSSVLTALRQNSDYGNQRPQSSSRSSSTNNIGQAENPFTKQHSNSAQKSA